MGNQEIGNVKQGNEENNTKQTFIGVTVNKQLLP